MIIVKVISEKDDVMKVEKDKIKDLFSFRLGTFESEVTISLWNKLDHLLSNKPVPETDSEDSATTNTDSLAKKSLKNKDNGFYALQSKTIPIVVKQKVYTVVI